MAYEDIKFLLPDVITENFDLDEDTASQLYDAALLIIKYYSGIDYIDSMIHELAAIFSKLASNKFEFSKELEQKIITNFDSAIETLRQYKFTGVLVSSVVPNVDETTGA